ncbi:MAG: PKD domain protein [Methanocella sp. PtaU1.Bin125]|nr:MAG: PKD domain protein [Methanocella sp. PtaU1.Bin125]
MAGLYHRGAEQRTPVYRRLCGRDLVRSAAWSRGIVFLVLVIVTMASAAVPVEAGNSVTVSGEISPQAVPVVAFVGAPTSGIAPLAVQFTDQSANDPTSWKWEYKQGSGCWVRFSTARNPSYVFTSAGTYSIRLTATNGAGSNTLTKACYIHVNAALKPVAKFSATPTHGYPPLTVFFTDKSKNSPTSWKWEYKRLGAGDWTTFSSAQNPAYTFTGVGYYSIRLTATNEAGSDTETRVGYIRVGHMGIVIAYFSGSPTSGNRPLTVQFKDQSYGNVDVREWDFQNDGTYDSMLENPSFTYPAKGKYSVKLRVSNALMTSTQIRYNYINVK